MSSPSSPYDQRREATRAAIQHAFLQLLFDRRYGQIRITEIAALASVGRSTFYEHFRRKDDLLIAVCDPILLPLASAASGRASRAVVRMMLDHVWERRGLGRVVLDSAAAPRLRRTLAAMIADRLAIEQGADRSYALLAMAAAVGQLTIVRMWIAGEVTASASDVADQLLAFARLTRPLTAPPASPAGRAENSAHRR